MPDHSPDAQPRTRYQEKGGVMLLPYKARTKNARKQPLNLPLCLGHARSQTLDPQHHADQHIILHLLSFGFV